MKIGQAFDITISSSGLAKNTLKRHIRKIQKHIFAHAQWIAYPPVEQAVTDLGQQMDRYIHMKA